MINFKEKTRQALVWSQKYTQTDMIYLAKGGSWLTLGEVVSIVVSFSLVLAFANLLPREIYGQYQYVLSIISIFVIFSLPGMNMAVIRATAKGHEGSFVPALKTRISFGLIGGLASLGLAGYYFLNENFVLGISFLVAALLLSLMDSLNIFHGYLKGKKLFKSLVKYVASIQLISAGCLIVVLFLTNNLFLILLTYLASYTVLRFIFLKIVLKKFPPNQKEDPQTLSYGKHLSLMGVADIIASRLDYILLWHFLGAGALAMYSFALLPVQKIKNLFSGTIRPLALPKLSQRSSKDLKIKLPRKVFKLFLILIPIVVIYIILAPFLYKILLPKYLESVFYSQVFALSILLVPEVLLSTSLIAQMEKRKLYIYKFTSPLVRIMSLLILTPLYGLIGAISAIIIAQIYTLGLVIFLFKRM